jgi:anion transporter
MGIILSFILTGVLPIGEAFSGFTNKNVVMFTAMFIIGAGLTKTSILVKIQSLVVSHKENPRRIILIAGITAGLLAILTSATATAAIMVPLLIGVSSEINISRSKLLYPAMVVANIATGMTFLGQGASNLAFSSIMMEAGGTTPFTIWDFTIARLPFFIVAIIYIATVSSRLLPDHPNESFDDEINKMDLNVISGVKERKAVAIILVTIVAILFSKQIGLEMFIIACLGAGALIVSGVLTEKEALGAIHLPTIFLFAGVLTLSNAIKITGAGEVVASYMITALGNTSNPYIIMAVFFIVPLVLTQVMSNIATIMIFVPLVSAAGASIGIDPRALVMGVLIAGCTSILTPMAAPAQTIIMGPGGYKMKDYLKAGLPLTLIITIMAIFILPIMFPFY